MLYQSGESYCSSQTLSSSPLLTFSDTPSIVHQSTALLLPKQHCWLVHCEGWKESVRMQSCWDARTLLSVRELQSSKGNVNTCFSTYKCKRNSKIRPDLILYTVVKRKRSDELSVTSWPRLNDHNCTQGMTTVTSK